MKWGKGFWNVCCWVVDTSIEAGTNMLNVVGSITCMMGGAGFAISYMLDKTLNASFFGSVTIPGTVLLNIDSANLGYHANDTFSFYQYKQIGDEKNYNLKDYISPNTIRVASGILFASGVALRTLSANVKKWQQGRVEKFYYKSKYGLAIDNPSLKEYFYVNAESLCDSISKTMFCNAVMVSLLDYSEQFTSALAYTYPSYGSQQVNNTYYNGPVISSHFPFEFSLNKNVSIKLPVEHMQVNVSETINATIKSNANLTYGGGVVVKSHDNPLYPVAIPIAFGVSAYLANSFFSKKIKHLRDGRIHQAEQKKEKGSIDCYSKNDLN